jgi:predicted GIY-YIG superfamily endonuclease
MTATIALPHDLRDTVPGTVYLIHFEKPYKHAKHYLGWTTDLDKRIALHRRGQGSVLLSVVNGAGIGWDVVRTWEGADRNFERRVKNRGGLARECPACGFPQRGQQKGRST